MDIPDFDKFGIFCMMLTTVYFLTPIPSFINLLKGKTYYEDTPIFTVVVNFCNCFLWYVHGLNLDCQTLKYGYGFCCFCSLIMILIYLLNEAKKNITDVILNFLLIITGCWATFRGLTTVIEDDELVFYICLFSNLLVYFAPLRLTYKSYKENNSSFLPIIPIYYSLVNCSFWIIYGEIHEEPISLPNYIGILLSGAQIWFIKKYKLQYAKKKEFNKIKRKINTSLSADDESKKIKEESLNNEEDSNEKDKVIPPKVLVFNTE